MDKPIRAYVNRTLLVEVKKTFPETGGLSNTGIVDWTLRKLLVLRLREVIDEVGEQKV